MVVGYHPWNARVDAYISHFMVDNYPPFPLEEQPSNPVDPKIAIHWQRFLIELRIGAFQRRSHASAHL